MSEEFRLEAHPAVLMKPRIVAPYGWVGHIPFAYLAVDLLKPACIVELGTHSGNSYMAFCQAVKQLGLASRCRAVDSWRGDEHASRYGEEVFDALRARHDPLYGDFSRLLRMDFDTAAGQFEDASIDLLHIDGLHTYEAVRHDFETWRGKLSRRAVVLLHDTHVEGRGFGVGKFYAELSADFPCFDFHHSNGLGVVAVGDEVPEAFLAFLCRAQAEPADIRRFFETLAGTLVDAEGNLAAAMHAERLAVVCRLYYRGRDEGYDDERSVSTVLDISNGVLDVRFRLPRGVSPDYLRLDFADFPGIYCLQRVSVGGLAGDQEVLQDLRGRLGYVHGELLQTLHESDVRLVGFDHDPYLEFDASDAIRRLEQGDVIEVTVRVGYELVLDDPAVSQFVGRYTTSIHDMAELSRQRMDLHEFAGLHARHQAEMAQRLQQLEEVVRQLASRGVWATLRGGTG